MANEDGTSQTQTLNNLDNKWQSSFIRLNSYKRSIFKTSQSLISYRKPKKLVSKLQLVLCNISLDLKAGTKLCIFHNDQKVQISCFIKLLLGDSVVVEGLFEIKGKIVYFNPKRHNLLIGNTIRNNIIFGGSFDEDRYNQVCKMINLNFDGYAGRDMY